MDITDKYHLPIYPKDVIPYLRRSEQTVQRMFAEVRDALGKKKAGRKNNAIITLQEFCDYHLINPELKNQIAADLK